METQNNNFW